MKPKDMTPAELEHWKRRRELNDRKFAKEIDEMEVYNAVRNYRCQGCHIFQSRN